MDTPLIRMAIVGSLLLVMFLSGYWLKRLGKPYPGAPFNIHKLVGLGTGVLLILTVSGVQRAAGLNPRQALGVGINVLFFVATVAAGGLLSTGGTRPSFVQLMHKILPYFAAISTAATLYLLLI